MVAAASVRLVSLPRRWRGWFRFCGIGEVGFVAAAVTVLPRRGYLLLGVGEVVFGCWGVGMVGFGMGKACCHLWLVCHWFGWCLCFLRITLIYYLHKQKYYIKNHF